MEVTIGILVGLAVGVLVTRKTNRVIQKRKALALAAKVEQLQRLQGGGD